MRGTHYSKETKKVIDRWRAKGKTYKEIKERFGVPKSTLSVWFSKKYAGIFSREKQFAHLARVRPLAIQAVKKRNELRKKILQQKISREVKTYPLADTGLQKSILAALYWAEGSKSAGTYGLKFANTDPDLMLLFITLLRNCFKPEEHRFRVHIYLHHYHAIRDAKQFWSGLLQIPQDQFWKTYIKKRSATKRFRKNFKGVCFLYHQDNRLRQEIMEIAHCLHNSYKKLSP